MDILKVIARDHKEVKSLIKKLEARAEKAGQETKALTMQLIHEILLHAKAEELALYRACRGESEKLRDFALEGTIEHKLVEATLKKLSKITPSADGKFKAALTVVKELIEHHAEEEEEEEMFPKLKKAFGEEERAEMGLFMIEAKEKLRPKIAAKLRG